MSEKGRDAADCGLAPKARHVRVRAARQSSDELRSGNRHAESFCIRDVHHPMQ